MCFTLNRHKPKGKSLLKRKPIRLGLIRLQIGWGGGVYWSVTVYIAWGCLWNFTSPFRTLHGGGRSWLVVNLVCKKKSIWENNTWASRYVGVNWISSFDSYHSALSALNVQFRSSWLKGRPPFRMTFCFVRFPEEISA